MFIGREKELASLQEFLYSNWGGKKEKSGKIGYNSSRFFFDPVSYPVSTRSIVSVK